MSDFKYEIVESYGKLSENAKGWTRMLHKISWNDRPAKYDIRDWAPDETKMGKGLTFTTEELRELRTILNKMDLDE
ncbi:hypothetical protein CL176_00520 [Suicoccus acidiformans]|uniref:Transcriptional coactivator p15 (PC4) C-terminal domain-containing protein n=1 Tax=Suicoccus acidiformans TaxID=2036206 RepID=A0A347WHS6_9LACT|nr:PC4/YdbC family ssDNA-binding protein [Suicoccus acidiformans]AXY24633.1 hypothetical protein CL176_00520 [Suicoccus acidiformans]